MEETTTPRNRTVREASTRLRCSERTVRNLVKRGELAGFWVGAHLRVPLDAIEAFENRKAA